MTSERIAELRRLTEKHEGRVAHFYLDTSGYVTVGIGHLVRNLVMACQLNMVPQNAIAADFHKVKGMQKGAIASAYAWRTTARMSDPAMDQLFEADARLFLAELRSSLPKFDAWPAPAQTAVFDMAFNLGLAGFLKYHQLLGFLDAGNFAAAAGECHRRGIPEERNTYTAQLFQQAA